MVPDATFTSYYGHPVVKPAPWGDDVAAYLFLGGVAGGSGLLAAGGQLTGRDLLRRNARLSALAAVALGGVALVRDLGRPERFYNMLRTFKLTSPITISDVPAAGTSVKQSITGELTLHGVTKTITMDVEGVIQDGKLVVVGSTDIAFADYNIGKPQGASVLSIADNGTMELQLIFQHA